MMIPENDWRTIPQGPPRPPPDIYNLLEPEGFTRKQDISLKRMTMLDHAEAAAGFDHTEGEGTYIVGYKYSGGYKGSLAHGEGKMTWADGLTYEGDTEHHKVQGRGKYKYPNGDTYEGDVLNGTRHGEGEYYRNATGERYTGTWDQGTKSGKGRMQYNSVSYYKGEWSNGERHGKGTMVYPSKSVYSGSWFRGKRHGKGTMKWVRNGTTTEEYKGTWKDGEMDGEGVHWYHQGQNPDPSPTSSSNYYVGSFKSNERHGQGTFIYLDGSRYEGSWVHNTKQGEGSFLYDTGVAYAGEFKEDKPVSAISLPEKPALSRYIPLNINDLLFGEADKERVLTRVQTLLSRHYGTLQRLYHHYAALNIDQENRSSHFTALSMLQFWKLLKDTSLIGSGVSLAAVDRIFLRFNDSQGRAALAAPRGSFVLEPIPPSLSTPGLESHGSERHVSKHLDNRSVKSGFNDRRKSVRTNTAFDGLRKGSLSRKISSSQAGGFATGAKTHRPSYRKESKAARTNIHNCTSFMYFREFTEAVVRIAHLKLSPFPQLTLADKLALCLHNDLKVTGGPPFLQELQEVSSVTSQYAELLRKLYGLYANRAHQGLSLHRRNPSFDLVMSVRQFLMLCKEAKILDSEMSMRAILGIFDAPLPLTSVPALEPSADPSGLAPFPPKGGKKHRLESIGCATIASGVMDPMTLTSLDSDGDRFTERSRSPAETQRGEGEMASFANLRETSVFARCDLSLQREGDARRLQRRQELETIIRGKNDKKLLATITVGQEILYEEYLAALVQVSNLKYGSKKLSSTDALALLIENHLVPHEFPTNFY